MFVSLPPSSIHGLLTRLFQRVSKASIAVMGVTKALVRRALVISVGAAPYVPIPGLLGVAKMLLIIWDAVQVVDVRVRLFAFLLRVM